MVFFSQKSLAKIASIFSKISIKFFLNFNFLIFFSVFFKIVSKKLEADFLNNGIQMRDEHCLKQSSLIHPFNIFKRSNNLEVNTVRQLL